MASILVIDDDRAVLATIRLLLERAGHAVESVDNSRTGLQLLGAQSLDGFETMKLVHESRPRMPIIVITGQQFSYSSEPAPDFLHMATRLGAVASLPKLFGPTGLLAAVTGVLSNSQSLHLARKSDGRHSL